MGVLDGWLGSRFWACTALNVLLVAAFFWPYGGLTWTAMNKVGYTGFSMPQSMDGISFIGSMPEWQQVAFYTAVYVSEIAFFDWLFFKGRLLGVWER